MLYASIPKCNTGILSAITIPTTKNFESKTLPLLVKCNIANIADTNAPKKDIVWNMVINLVYPLKKEHESYRLLTA